MGGELWLGCFSVSTEQKNCYKTHSFFGWFCTFITIFTKKQCFKSFRNTLKCFWQNQINLSNYVGRNMCKCVYSLLNFDYKDKQVYTGGYVSTILRGNNLPIQLWSKCGHALFVYNICFHRVSNIRQVRLSKVAQSNSKFNHLKFHIHILEKESS